ncbi:hypothetical protein CY34DRAFT_347800 [Suillus luteus UH-Slu-Lm8-n1]|uniref:Uncharacterized protein n=1 Tax=Suillus luteus UH-Slu-Lm8-n1 TaxID=930992 RepID=A0A0C9ZNE8_9AGAM|nr:hypothetical protein CY34DRAFT_347800 [Suillus luteus UH-Slu-Lm8-n1]
MMNHPYLGRLWKRGRNSVEKLNTQYTHHCSLVKEIHNPSTTSSKMSQLVPSTTPIRTFEAHEDTVWAAAVFPDRRRMVATCSEDKTLRLWDLETGAVLKKMEGHSSEVWALVVSRDGQIIASGDRGGELIVWHGDTGESITQPIKAHSERIASLDFSPDGTLLATAGNDSVNFWCTKMWQMQGKPFKCGARLGVQLPL